MAEAKEEDGLFVMLYTEIFYRHIHKREPRASAYRVPSDEEPRNTP